MYGDALNDELGYDEPMVRGTATEALHVAVVNTIRWIRVGAIYPSRLRTQDTLTTPRRVLMEPIWWK